MRPKICSAASLFSVLLTVLPSGLMPVIQAQRIPFPLPRPAEVARPSLADALQWMGLHAPVILSGEVLSAAVTPPGGTPPDPSHMMPTVVVVRVDTAIAGVVSGQDFTLTSWPGSDGPALSPGERVVLFLHQPNAAGFTSPVRGAFGVLRIGGGGLADVRLLLLLAAQLSPGLAAGPRLGWRRGCRPAGPPERWLPEAANCVLPVGPGVGNHAVQPSSMPATQLIAMLQAMLRADTAASTSMRKEQAHAR